MCFPFWRCCSETAQPRRTTLPQATHVFSSCDLHLSSSTTKPQFKWIPRRTWRFQAPKRCHVAVSRRKILCGKNVAATHWVAAKIMPPVLRFTVSGAAWWSWHGMRPSPWHPVAGERWPPMSSMQREDLASRPPSSYCSIQGWSSLETAKITQTELWKR